MDLNVTGPGIGSMQGPSGPGRPNRRPRAVAVSNLAQKALRGMVGTPRGEEIKVSVKLMNVGQAGSTGIADCSRACKEMHALMKGNLAPQLMAHASGIKGAFLTQNCRDQLSGLSRMVKSDKATLQKCMQMQGLSARTNLTEKRVKANRQVANTPASTQQTALQVFGTKIKNSLGNNIE